jgi:predicted GNAT family acetyltransferase
LGDRSRPAVGLRASITVVERLAIRTLSTALAGPAYDAGMTTPPSPPPIAAELVVEDNRDESRYEAWIGDRLVGIAEYEHPDEAGPITFVHTEVLPGAEGRGVGRGLARAALDDVRARGLKLIPECEFIAGFLKRHPDDRDLIATPDEVER